jgi:predicted RNA-binding protein associated with RNAse of E/G family
VLLCLEKKLTLAGRTQTYSCELRHYEAGFGILRYVIDREYDIAGLLLAPGDETIALYWEDRPYTLYIWRRKSSPQPVYYFNIADQISLSRREFVWRDLVVDILVDERGIHVLDEHELPADIEPELAHSIQAAKTLVMCNHRAIIEEVNDAVRKHTPPTA